MQAPDRGQKHKERNRHTAPDKNEEMKKQLQEAVICSELKHLEEVGYLTATHTHTLSERENEQLRTRVTLFFSFCTCFGVIFYTSVCVDVFQSVLLLHVQKHQGSEKHHFCG